MAEVGRVLRTGDAADGLGEQRRQLSTGERPQDRDQTGGHQRDEHPARDITTLPVGLASLQATEDDVHDDGDARSDAGSE